MDPTKREPYAPRERAHSASRLSLPGGAGLRPWAQALPSIPPAGRAGPTRRAAAGPRPSRLGLSPARPEQA